MAHHLEQSEWLYRHLVTYISLINSASYKNTVTMGRLGTLLGVWKCV